MAAACLENPERAASAGRIRPLSRRHPVSPARSFRAFRFWLDLPEWGGRGGGFGARGPETERDEHAHRPPQPESGTRRTLSELDRNAPEQDSSGEEDGRLVVQMLFDVIDGVLDSPDLLRVLVRNIDLERLFERQHELHQPE